MADEELIEGAEGGEELIEGAEGGEEGHQATPASRGQARIQKLANERAEALAEARAAKEQADFYKRQAEQLQQQHRPSQQDDVYRDPDEVWRQQTEAKLNQSLFAAQDMQDKAAYDRQAARNPLYSKYEDRVEEKIREARSKGQNPTREGVLFYLIGEDAAKNQGKTTPAAKQAQQRVQAAKAKPVNAGSNVTSPRGEKSLEERLSGMIL